jgi:hypothetical protein
MPRIITRIMAAPLVGIPRGVPIIVPAGPEAIKEIRPFVGDKLRVATFPATKVDLLRRWYFAVVSELADGLGVLKDDLHAALKDKAHFYDGWVLGERGPYPVLRSLRDGISFTDLSAYVDHAVEVIFIDYLGGDALARRNLMDRVEKLVGHRPC